MFDRSSTIKKLGKELLLENLKRMLLIRNFEVRAEAAYLQGNVGGFFHSYIGQEAIQTAAIQALGPKQWYITSYRCHALALLLGATANELMAELYGRANGNALGRGGSMHFYTPRLMGGFGIVGGQIPIATGAAFALKYQKIPDQVAVCFMGDGAVAQGAFHESLNLAALWDLPCIYVIENNFWGMGTAVANAISVEKIAESKAVGYGIKGYTFNGMDFLECIHAFDLLYDEVLSTKKPVLAEFVTKRFKGHSVSDPGFYRSKDEVKEDMQRDPIIALRDVLIEEKMINLDEFKTLDKSLRQVAIDAMKHAEESPWPSVGTLEEDVFAP